MLAIITNFLKDKNESKATNEEREEKGKFNSKLKNQKCDGSKKTENKKHH